MPEDSSLDFTDSLPLGTNLTPAGVWTAIDCPSAVAQAHATQLEAGVLARLLAGLGLTVVGADDGDIALAVQHDTALGAQAGSGNQDVAIPCKARGIARAVAGDTDHDIAHGTK